MWRSAVSNIGKSKKLVVNKAIKPSNIVRWQSSKSEGSKGGKTALIVIGTAVLGTGAAFVYAQQDPKFQQRMKDNLPYGDLIFTYIPDWGDKSKKSPDKATLDAAKEKANIEAGLLKRRLEREKEAAKAREEMAITPPPSPPIVAPPTPPKPEPIKASTTSKSAPTTQKVVEEDEKSKKQKQEEANATSLNTALERNLTDSQEALARLSKDALQAQEIAVNAIKTHAELLFKALDESKDPNDDSLWNEVNLAQETKISSLTKATETIIDAKAGLDRLQARIHEGKDNKSTANNAALLSAEEAVSGVSQQLKKAEENLATAQVEAKAANLYKELIENGSQQLQKELEALLPADAKGRKLSEEELTLLLGHAHQRLKQLQRHLAKQEATEQLRIRHALDELKNRHEATLGQHIGEELTKQRHRLEDDIKRRESKMAENFEKELRQQLRRQAAAHSDHLQEALNIREEELARQSSLQAQEELLKQQGMHQKEVGEAMSRLKGIQHYLQAREELEKSSRKAQQLWLACQALRSMVRFGAGGSEKNPAFQEDERSLKPLKGQVDSIREAAGTNDPLYDAVLKAIPQKALERGVYTEESLRMRFSNVERVCKRLAMLENIDSPAQISLYRYFLSYVRSYLVIDAWSSSVTPSQLEAELKAKAVVEPAKLSTGDVLARVRACLERRDLEQALRYANLLRGEPARAARDWLTEARLSLEARQAADALMAQAAAITVQAYH